jgi:hypothetical protein
MSLDSSYVPGNDHKLRMDRLPLELRRGVIETLGSPVIPLFVGRPDEHKQGVLWRFAGSGLLVEIDGVAVKRGQSN